MSALTLQQAHEIAGQLLCMAKSIRKYRNENNHLLSSDEKSELNNIHSEIIGNANKINMLSVIIAIDDIEKNIQEINCITDKLSDVTKKIKNIQQVIDFSAEVLSLATGILEGDSSAISKSIDTIKKLFNTI